MTTAAQQADGLGGRPAAIREACPELDVDAFVAPRHRQAIMGDAVAAALKLWPSARVMGAAAI